jgi:hypothetical protein
MSDTHTDYIPVHVGGVQVGWMHLGVYTPAVRCDPPGQPISSLPKPLDRGHWGDQ